LKSAYTEREMPPVMPTALICGLIAFSLMGEKLIVGFNKINPKVLISQHEIGCLSCLM
jgi:hypothetical protein